MKQRGSILFYALIAVAVLAALTGLVMAWNAYISGVEQTGYARGKQETEATYAKRDNEQLRATIAAKEAAEAKVAATELKAKATFALLAADYQKDVDNEAKRNRAVLDDLRAGRIVLHDPGATGPAQCLGGQSPETAAGASRGDAAAQGRFSREASERFWADATLADEITLQLAACQAVVRADREINGER